MGWHASLDEPTYPDFYEGDLRKREYYDDEGNLITEAYFGADGEPRLNSEGLAKVTYRYDDQGNIIEEAYFGTDGEPIPVNGFVRLQADYSGGKE